MMDHVLVKAGAHRGRGAHRRKTLAALSVTAVAAAMLSLPQDTAKAATGTQDPFYAAASVAEARVANRQVAGVANSYADANNDPGPNRSGIGAGTANGNLISIAGVNFPLSDFVDYGQAGALQSESTATSPYSAKAISGTVGADGSINLDGANGDSFAPMSVNLLGLLNAAHVDGLVGSLISKAQLRFGIGGSEVVVRNGDFQDPDGVGGIGRYRVGQADLDLQSPAVATAAALINAAVARLDTETETLVNQYLDLSKVALPDGSTVTASVDSQMQDKIFKAILAQPITSVNKILTVDFSTGLITVHLDQALHNRLRPGQQMGLNAQNPNTELVDDTLYPMIAESVHDLMHEVTRIAVNAIAGSLGSVTVNFTVTNPSYTGTASENLMAAQWDPGTCTPNAGADPSVCNGYVAMMNAARTGFDNALVPARDFVLGSQGDNLYTLAIDDIKTGSITVPIRTALSPFFDVLSKVVSVQLNAQRVGTCAMPDGTTRTSSLRLSAVSVAVLRAQQVAELNLGNAQTAADACAPNVRASLVDVASGRNPLASVGHSEARWPDNPGENRNGASADLLGQQVISVNGVSVPLSDFIRYGQAGGLLSASRTSGPMDGRGVAGVVGSDGSVNLDNMDGSSYDPVTIDLLSAFKKFGVSGITNTLVDQATLKLGLGGAEVTSLNGVLKSRYRVGQADLDMHSPAIKQAAAQMYDAVGLMDTATENALNPLLQVGKVGSLLPGGVTLTGRIDSAMQDNVFNAILAKPVTTKNKLLTVDFSTGTATLHLDQWLHNRNRPGDNLGMNDQLPNTELIDSELYPMIAETVHDLMNEVITIAVGAAQGALGSITVDWRATAGTAPNNAVATWTTNLMGTPPISNLSCAPGTGALAGLLCSTLTAAINLTGPVISTVLVPLRDFVLGDAGANLYTLAITDIKTNGITIPIRGALEPFIQQVAKVFSVQLNHQQTGTCVMPDGSTRLASLRTSAVSVAFLRASDGARVDFGNAEVHTPCQ
jgi:hypothetical protein